MDNLNHNQTPPLSQKELKTSSAVNRSLVVLLIIMTLTAVGLGIWGYIEHNRDCNPASEPIQIVSEFEKAFESGKSKEVGAVFTEDGILTTASNIHSAFTRGVVDESGKVGTPDFNYLATIHGNQDLTIIGTPILVGDNTVAFGWEWASGVSGTAILHVRDGKIVIAILNPSQYVIPLGGE